MMEEFWSCILSAVLAALIISASANHLHGRPILKSFSPHSATVHIQAADGDGHLFTLNFPKPLEEAQPVPCASHDSGLCLKWGDSVQLEVGPLMESGLRTINASSLRIDFPVEFCFNITGQHLYGGPIKNVYPQEGTNLVDIPYITGDAGRLKINQPVAERYWYTSSGLNLKIFPELPIFINQNRTSLCFLANNSFPYQDDKLPQFIYETCPYSKNLRDGLECFFKQYSDKGMPPKNVISSPIWSTWVEYKLNNSQDNVLEFLHNIQKYSLNISVLEIDEPWETCFGSQEFNSKFPDPKSMVDLIHEAALYATLWVHSFIGPGCKSLDSYAPYLAKLPNGSIGLTDWWSGKGAALVDFNNPNASQWFQKRLQDLKKKYGFDSFKFDAGEASYIPGMSIDEKTVRLPQPNLYTTNYVEMAATFGNLAEVRVGSQTSNAKLMHRLQDTNSVWKAEKWGLRSVIPSVLQLSLHGYGAVLPDMIGGNAYSNSMPSKELYVRWMQLNTFLPVMQFSLGPWHFDDETIKIARGCMDLHYQNRQRFINEFSNTSHPVINPVWWNSPKDTTAQVISDEFLVGNSLLVAPVVEEGAVSRDIYLPEGRWKDSQTGELYLCPRWLRNYSAPLTVLPYFTS